MKQPEQAKDPVILVAIEFAHAEKTLAEDLAEVTELALTAGAIPVATLTGNRSFPDAKYFIGSGKALELQALLQHTGAKLVIINHALTPSQERNLEQLCQCRVVDRTQLILDIFAQRARTYEGKLQVELAQLEYLSTRLVRGWSHLERQRGGIGLRGPGETQLETDRRLIRQRVKTIKQRLQKVQQQRQQSRRARTKQDIPVVALVGYTNAGKSTVFNQLTGANVLAEDKLFATLDPTLRRIKLPYAKPIILSDTVGFIQDLPPDLVAAFRATLEEATNAALLLHIIDAADPRWRGKMDEVDRILEEIGAVQLPQIRVFNKIDCLPDMVPRMEFDLHTGYPKVWISALKDRGIKKLLAVIRQQLFGELIKKKVVLTVKQAALRHELYTRGWVIDEEITKEGAWQLTLQVAKKCYMQGGLDSYP